PGAVVYVEPVGIRSYRFDVGAQLVENMGSDVIGRAVRAVDDDLHSAKVEGGRERALAELDVAAAGVFDAAGFPEARRILAADGALELRLDVHLDAVGKLAALRGKKLDAVVLIRVVRSADHDPGLQAQRPGQIGDRWGRQRSGQHHVNPRRGESG